MAENTNSLTPSGPPTVTADAGVTGARATTGATRMLAFDVETTGTDPESDRIVELALVPIGEPVRTFRVNPGLPIPPGATAVHSIRDEDVRDAPPFAAVAAEVQALVTGAILLGYNSRTFDTVILDAELRRAGQPGLDLDAVAEIDVLRVWREVEPRTLSGAARRWLGREHEHAHEAASDAAVTLEVWDRIRAAHALELPDGVALTRRDDEVDRHGRFVRDPEGHAVFNFGKHRGKRVPTVHDWNGYLTWMLTSDFPTSTKAVASRLIESGGRLPAGIGVDAAPRAVPPDGPV